MIRKKNVLQQFVCLLDRPRITLNNNRLAVGVRWPKLQWPAFRAFADYCRSDGAPIVIVVARYLFFSITFGKRARRRMAAPTDERAKYAYLHNARRCGWSSGPRSIFRFCARPDRSILVFGRTHNARVLWCILTTIKCTWNPSGIIPPARKLCAVIAG